MINFILFFNIIFLNKILIESRIIDFNDGVCLPPEKKASWIRHVFHNKSPLIIESTRRSSHKMVSFIMAILLKERLGYANIKLRETSWDDTITTLNRLTCNKRQCEDRSPTSHINLEVWMSPGFTSREWVNDNLIIDCGPLGPSARTGIFYYHHSSRDVSFDDWRSLSKYPNQNISPFNLPFTISKQLQVFRPCNDTTSELCATNFAIDPDLPLENASFLNKLFGNWTVGIKEPDESHYLFFNWYPNTLTVQKNISRILFHDCNEGAFSIHSDICENSVNQLTKVIWSGLRTKAPLIYTLIDSFQITDEQLFTLLIKLNVHSNTYENYYHTACQWIIENEMVWNPLTSQWNSTKFLTVIIMLPQHEGNFSLDENYALLHAVDSLNKDMKIFGNKHYQFQFKLSLVSCDRNEMLEEYLTMVNVKASDNNNHIVGIITGLPTECMELVSKITNVQKKITISYRHEILPMSLRYGNASYIFQTISSKETYYSLLLKISKHFGWSRNVIITDNHDYLSGFNTTYILKVYKVDHINENHFNKFLTRVKKKVNAKIFIVDFMGDDIFKILCIAGRLKMTLAQKYVWFINMDLIYRQIPIELSGCEKDIKLIIKNYFYLTPNNPPSIMPCSNLYSDNLYRAMIILGKAASRITKINPGFKTFNADNIVNNINEIYTEQYFCSGKFIKHDPVKMEHNSLFWTQWYLYQNKNSTYIPVFNFKISKKYEIGDIVRNEMRKENSAFWGKGIRNIPNDGRKINKENCWAQFLATPLNIKCINAEILLIIFITILMLATLVIFLVMLYRKRISEINYPMNVALKLLVQDLLDINIDSSNLFLNHIIGRGAFGMVYGGEARNNRGILEAVAVKAISETSDWDEKMDFLTEAKVMRKLHHRNIVELIGVCLDSGNNMIFLIMELMVEGDLRNYLLSRRTNAATNSGSDELRVRLTNFARDIAEGLNYMHSKFMVHRDVACRNCLITHDIRVKLGDFGLTKYLQPASTNGYYKYEGNVNLPVRWMPPEAIKYGLFSIKSDIWSYGILLFEIVTFGVCPYQDLSSSRNIELMELIKTNALSIINYLPLNAKNSIVHQLISQCCEFNPPDRPDSIDQLLAILQSDRTCIRPYLTDDPPKSESDKKLDNLSDVDLQRLCFDEDEVPVTSPSEVPLSSSQRYIDIINRAFRIRPTSMKERNDFPLRNLRPCHSSVTISRSLLTTDVFDCMSFDQTPDLLIGSIPSDLCHNMELNKKNRTSIQYFRNNIKFNPKALNNKFRFSSKDL